MRATSCGGAAAVTSGTDSRPTVFWSPSSCLSRTSSPASCTACGTGHTPGSRQAVAWPLEHYKHYALTKVPYRVQQGMYSPAAKLKLAHGARGPRSQWPRTSTAHTITHMASPCCCQGGTLHPQEYSQQTRHSTPAVKLNWTRHAVSSKADMPDYMNMDAGWLCCHITAANRTGCINTIALSAVAAWLQLACACRASAAPTRARHAACCLGSSSSAEAAGAGGPATHCTWPASELALTGGDRMLHHCIYHIWKACHRDAPES
jgi:hypothetical protein